MGGMCIVTFAQTTLRKQAILYKAIRLELNWLIPTLSVAEAVWKARATLLPPRLKMQSPIQIFRSTMSFLNRGYAFSADWALPKRTKTLTHSNALGPAEGAANSLQLHVKANLFGIIREALNKKGSDCFEAMLVPYTNALANHFANGKSFPRGQHSKEDEVWSLS